MVWFARNIRLETRIKNMRLGEIGYTVPWAYDPKTNKLNLEYSVEPATHGTVQMEVICLGRENYTVKVLNDFKY